jgi:sulfite reductase (NADPH) flavoprotein alpha-component
MAHPALLPETAPFALPQRQELDRLLRGSSAAQRQWLSGFLAGLEAANGAGAVPTAPPAARTPLLILYATESGNAEALANDTAAAARRAGFKPELVDFADLELAKLAAARDAVVIASTWGEGEPPARAARAYGELMGAAAPRLDNLRYAVLALGDTAYANFCETGRAIDTRLEALGAKRAAPRADLDLDFRVPAKAWIDGALKALAPGQAAPVADNVVAVDFRPAEAAVPERVRAEVTAHTNLNSSRSDKRTFHLELELERPLPYLPGDALELFAPNDPAMVDAVLRAACIAPDDALAAKLAAERDITTLSAPLIARYLDTAAPASVPDDLRAAPAEWARGRQLIDLLEAAPADLAPKTLLALTRPLPPRAYSIASSRAEVGDDAAHLLVAPVEYVSHGRARRGVASTHIADRLRTGASIDVRLRANKHFRLPADPARDIVMVGPGTGVAPFRAFVQERAAAGASGRNWLFFGERRFLNDFLYQTEWQAALKAGTLHRLSPAFSRDGPAKLYVQHRMAEQARELVDWLEGGAHFYVCGDASRMAKDVRAALVAAFASVKAVSPEAAQAEVAKLEREKRYLTDVY